MCACRRQQGRRGQCDGQRHGSHSVLVGYSATEALERLRRDTSISIRVRWTLDAEAAQRLRAVLADDEGVRVHALDEFIDSFHGADELPAAGQWLRCRETVSHLRSGVPPDCVGSMERAWCMRTVRRIGSDAHVAKHARSVAPYSGKGTHQPLRRAKGTCPCADRDAHARCRDAHVHATTTVEPPSSFDGRASCWTKGHPAQNAHDVEFDAAPAVIQPCRRQRRIYIHTDEHDDARILRALAPDSRALDLSDLALNAYARIVVERTSYAIVTPGACDGTATGVHILVDTVIVRGGRARTVVQGSAVVCDVPSASRLVALLCAAGIDPDAPPPPSKVAAYLAYRRPVLCARLVQRGALDEASFDTV